MLQGWWNALQPSDQLGVAVFAGGVTVIALFATRKVLGNIMSRKRARRQLQFQQQLRQLIEDGDFGKMIEDRIVCEIQKKIAGGQINRDDARMIYAHYSRLGLWGLYPRKMPINPTGLDKTELKERLMKKFADQGLGKWPQRWRLYIGVRAVSNELSGEPLREQPKDGVLALLAGLKF